MYRYTRRWCWCDEISYHEWAKGIYSGARGEDCHGGDRGCSSCWYSNSVEIAGGGQAAPPDSADGRGGRQTVLRE